MKLTFKKCPQSKHLFIENNHLLKLSTLELSCTKGCSNNVFHFLWEMSMKHGNMDFLFFDFSLFLNNAMLFIPVHLYLTLLVSYTHTKTHWKLLGDSFECTSARVSKPHLHLCKIYSDLSPSTRNKQEGLSPLILSAASQ